MNKNELINSMAKHSGLTKTDAEKALNAFILSVESALIKGEKVSLVGFGSFSLSSRKATEGRNPRTGEKIKIAASQLPRFKAGKGLKEAVNSKKHSGSKKSAAGA